MVEPGSTRPHLVTKVLLPELAKATEFQARIVGEGKLAAKLHHPPVVEVTDSAISRSRSLRC
jgi:hypothetical protein